MSSTATDLTLNAHSRKHAERCMISSRRGGRSTGALLSGLPSVYKLLLESVTDMAGIDPWLNNLNTIWSNAIGLRLSTAKYSSLMVTEQLFGLPWLRVSFLASTTMVKLQNNRDSLKAVLVTLKFGKGSSLKRHILRPWPCSRHSLPWLKDSTVLSLNWL
jgi:hypothetical protein